MMRSQLSFFLLAFIALLAGKAAALEIDVGGTVGNVSATDFLAPNDIVLSACTNECSNGTSAITACSTNDTCICDTPAVQKIQICQDCMFHQLIHLNKLPDDPRAGQSAAMAAFQTACNATVQVLLSNTEIALTLPADWDGPFGQGLNVGGTVVSVIVAFFLGLGLITVVNTM